MVPFTLPVAGTDTDTNKLYVERMENFPVNVSKHYH